jgi:hypothetical protein
MNTYVCSDFTSPVFGRHVTIRGGIAAQIPNIGTKWKWSASRPGRFTPSIHLKEGWMDPKTYANSVDSRVYLFAVEN